MKTGRTPSFQAFMEQFLHCWSEFPIAQMNLSFTEKAEQEGWPGEGPVARYGNKRWGGLIPENGSTPQVGLLPTICLLGPLPSFHTAN